jgi:oxygen-independent coproporphyrinogen-3 oxidase
MDVLGKNGYEHYEISNFCKPGYYSRHNSSYWKQARYLGVGPSAHSYNGASRQANVSNNGIYQRKVMAGTVPAEVELLTRENKINEYIFTSLRTMWGCDLAFLKTALGHDLAATPAFQFLVTKGLLYQRDHMFYLSPSGKLLADQISSDLFISD